MAVSIVSRRLDFLYLVFFVVHIPVMLCIDLTPLYPLSLKPRFMSDIRQWYVETYSDQFFVSPPKWFEMYLWLEALLHLPVSVWAIGALLRDDPLVPPVLLLFAVETVVTTLTCVADYTSWDNVTREVKRGLAGLYLPYLILGILMMLDTFLRIRRKLTATTPRSFARKQI